MMRSLFNGVSGLRVHQTKMDVIADNIANVNTYGFKYSRITFKEVFNQSLSSATSPNDASGRAGTNPTQIGLGAAVANIDKIMTQGSPQRTDAPTDIMITGEGFFVVGDGVNQYFTRAGNFILDKNGNLSQNGLKLCGWDVALNQVTMQYEVKAGKVQPISITGTKEYSNPESTSIINFSDNMNPNTDSKIVRSMAFYDTVGTRYVADVVFTYDTSAKNWKYEIGTEKKDSSGNITVDPVAYANDDRTKEIKFTFTPASGTIGFDDFGIINNVNGVQQTDPPIAMEFALQVQPVDALIPPAQFGKVVPGSAPDNTIIINFDKVTQFTNEFSDMKATNANGYEPGKLDGISITPDGTITGRYTNNQIKILGRIPVATFKNPAGLEKIGNNLYQVTANSGNFDGVGIIGSLQSGALEMSNVDLAAEFTEMITTQRGFQANSRVITTSDDILQELVNLKR